MRKDDSPVSASQIRATRLPGAPGNMTDPPGHTYIHHTAAEEFEFRQSSISERCPIGDSTQIRTQPAPRTHRNVPLENRKYSWKASASPISVRFALSSDRGLLRDLEMRTLGCCGVRPRWTSFTSPLSMSSGEATASGGRPRFGGPPRKINLEVTGLSISLAALMVT